MAARLRSLGWVSIAGFYFLLAQVVASRAAHGLSSGDWFELIYRSILLFLLLLGFFTMGIIGQGQTAPLKEMGLVRRPGWTRELATGAALGWGGLIACVLPVALVGGLTLFFTPGAHQFLFFGVDALVLALSAMAEEVVFRGYPFQRLIEAVGPLLATLAISVLFALLHWSNPQSSAASLVTTMLAGWLLAIAYLRTRALWVGLGFHFAWNASMALLFGLPLSGITSFSPVLSTYSRGPVWLTGGGYGPEGSAVAIVVLLVLIVLLVVATRELKYRYATPVIVPGGIPVDLDAISRRQHEAAMGAAPPSSLVQIAPAEPPLPHPPQRSAE